MTGTYTVYRDVSHQSPRPHDDHYYTTFSKATASLHNRGKSSAPWGLSVKLIRSVAIVILAFEAISSTFFAFLLLIRAFLLVLLVLLVLAFLLIALDTLSSSLDCCSLRKLLIQPFRCQPHYWRLNRSG